MARIRTIKPEFWQHPKVTRACRDARLLFLGLLNEADDEGKMRYSSKRLAGVLFGDDDDVSATDVDAWTAELESVGLVTRYEVDGASLLIVPGFLEHQKVSHPTPSRLPSPQVSLRNPPESLPKISGIAPETFVPEGKGKEGKRKGRELAPAERTRDVLWEALIAAWALDDSELTETERGRVNKAAKLLRDIAADPGEIQARKQMFQVQWPDVTPTMLAVAGRWAECRPDPARLAARAPRSTSSIARAVAGGSG